MNLRRKPPASGNLVWKKIKSFFKLNWVLIGFIILAYFLIKNKLSAYLKPIKYESVVEIARKDSTAFIREQFVHVKITTKSVFLPYEKIRVSAKLVILDSSFKQFAKSKTKLLWFEGSQLTKNKINEENDKLTPKPNDKLAKSSSLFLDLAGKDNGRLLFLPTTDPDIYAGEAEIIYTRPGTELVSIIYLGRPKHILEPIKMQIGSSVDLENKRTNDLLFIIAILGFLIAVYTGFKIKSKNLD